MGWEQGGGVQCSMFRRWNEVYCDLLFGSQALPSLLTRVNASSTCSAQDFLAPGFRWMCFAIKRHELQTDMELPCRIPHCGLNSESGNHHSLLLVKCGRIIHKLRLVHHPNS